MGGNNGRPLLRRAHRWLGLALLAPLLLLLISGILLNHAEGLHLDQRYAGAWLTTLYGVSPPPPETGYAVGDRWLSRARDLLFLDAHPIGESPEPLIGAVADDGMLAAADPRGLRLFTPDGRLIDRLELPARAIPASRLALVDGRPALTGPHGTYRLDADATGWRTSADEHGDPVPARPLPASLRSDIADRLAARTLTWERVLLDLHSGRLLGSLGPWLVDLVALAATTLVVTGLIMWLRGTPAARRRARRPR